LSGTTPAAIVEFTAPPSGQLSLTALVTEITQSSPVVAVSVPAPVMVQVTRLVTLGLTLSTPGMTVEAGSTFSVTVQTDAPVPAEAAVSVMVTFDGSTQTETLSAGETAATVVFTAPGTTTGPLTVAATGAPSVTDENVLQLTVTPAADAEVTVVPVAIALTLTAPGVVDGGSTFIVVVDTNRLLPAGTEVMLIVQFGSASTPVTLSGTMASVEFTAPPEGLLELAATVTEITQSSPVVTVSAPAPIDVQVTELRDIMLTVSAPLSATVGTTITVTVAVVDAGPLPAGTEVIATVSFQTAGGDEMMQVVLTPPIFSDTLMFRVPVTAGVFAVAVSGSVEETNALRVTVTGDSALVTVEPLAVMLQLSGPGEVTVGSTYQVTVDTEVPVPTGTTLTVTVSADAAPPEMVVLTADSPSDGVTFTAPVRADIVTVTAMAAVQTAEGDLEVAQPAVATLAVTVSALDVQLVLSDLPAEPVAAGSIFPVTVGAEPEVPAGTTVTVTVRLAAFSSEPVVLTPSTPTASVAVTAPDVGGSAVLLAEGAATADSVLDLNVLAVTATVRVQEQVQLSLQLEAPAEVTARVSFEVRVSSEPEVPAGATVTVTVRFDGIDSEPVTLRAEATSAAVTLMAPGRVEAGLMLTASGSAEVADANVQVRVTPAAAALVDVVPQEVQLTLAVPDRVNIGEEVELTVGVEPALLADTTLTVAVFFGASSQQ